MPRVGCDAELIQTTAWCPKTRSAHIDPSMFERVLFAGNSATGTVKAAFFTIILFYRISLFI